MATTGDDQHIAPEVRALIRGLLAQLGPLLERAAERPDLPVWEELDRATVTLQDLYADAVGSRTLTPEVIRAWGDPDAHAATLFAGVARALEDRAEPRTEPQTLLCAVAVTSVAEHLATCLAVLRPPALQRPGLPLQGDAEAVLAADLAHARALYEQLRAVS